MQIDPIQTTNLSKQYKKDVNALNKVSLSIKEGEIFGLIGQNGAGKTTLLKLILGFIHSSAGEILIYGKRNATEFRGKIGYLPEKVSIHPFLTAMEFLRLCGRLYHLDSASLEKRCEEVLERVGLLDKRNEKISTFSKGMNQRLGLAQAIIHKPALLLLDEPGSGLDPIGLIELRNIILEENKTNKTTVFINSHRLMEAEKLCSRIAILHKGEMVAIGSMDELTRTKNQIHITLENMNDRLNSFFNESGNNLKVDGNKISFDPKESVDIRTLPVKIVENGGNLLKYEIVNENLEEIFIRITKGEK